MSNCMHEGLACGLCGADIPTVIDALMERLNQEVEHCIAGAIASAQLDVTRQRLETAQQMLDDIGAEAARLRIALSEAEHRLSGAY